MFSYRHAFHAGNHADVLKHAVLVHLLRYLTQKETALYVVDTHAGPGLCQLESAYAQKSGEAKNGIFRLWPLVAENAAASDRLPVLLAEYLSVIGAFNPSGLLAVYPGSPWISQRLLRRHDRLRLFELHPTDRKMLDENIRTLHAGRQVSMQAADGFEGLKGQLPPPSRRGLVLIDPSYEIKTDYERVVEALADSLKRFATGTYAVWYPVIASRESQHLPDQLRRTARASARSWLDAGLRIRAPSAEQRSLAASGVFVINPPFTLHGVLKAGLPVLAHLLGQDEGAGFTLASDD